MPIAALDTLPPRALDQRPVPPNATLVACRTVTENIRLLRIRRDEGPIPFLAGQYISLGLSCDGRWLQRPYSPAGLPAGDEVELLIRRVDEGELTPRLWRTPVGTRVRLGPAKGLFRLTPGDHRTHLFLGTGTGIAPLVAMAAALLELAHPPPIVTIQGVRHANELAFRNQLEDWTTAAPGFTYVPAVSRGSAGAMDPRVVPGRALDVLPNVCTGIGITPTSVVAYLCGNPAVVDGAARWLAQQGLESEAIRREEYWPAS